MDPSREPTSPPEAPLPDDVHHAIVPVSRWTNLWLSFLSLFILATLVLGSIRHNLREVYRDNLSYWDSRMSNSAVERLSYATLWLKERRTDTMVVARNPVTVRVLAAAAHRSHVLEARPAAEHALERIARDNGFLGGAVADTECRIVAQASIPRKAMAGVAKACQLARHAVDFTLSVSGWEPSQLWLYLAYPVFGGGETSPSGPVPRRQLGVAVLVVEPWKALLPFLTVDSESQDATDTLVVWPYGSETIVFSPRLAMQGVQSMFRRPLSDRTLESLASRRDNVEFGEFVDYRGVRVFGAARYSDVADASVIRKVERKGALAEFRRRSILEWSAGALFVLLLGSMIVAQQRHIETRNLKEKVRQQQALLNLKRHVEVSEERFRELVESVEAIVWEDERATLQANFVSKGAERILGYSTDQWVQTPDFWPDHIHPEDRERAEAAERSVREKCASRVVEYRMFAADGRTVWFRDYMYAKPGPDGKAAQLRGIMVDITEIKATEEALRESRQLLQTTLYSLRDAVFIMNLEGGEIVECNPAAMEMFGYHREEMVGQGPRFLHVDAAALQEFRERLAAAVAEQGFLEQFEFQLRRKDGSVFPTSHTVTPLRDGRGKQTGWVSVVQDITDRKRAEEALRQSEQRYRDFISHSNEGVWRVEFEQPVPLDLAEEESLERILQYGYLAECNAAYVRSLGLSTPEELLGKRLGDLIPPGDLREETIESFRSAVRGGFQCRTVAFRTSDKKGNLKYLFRTETPMVENRRLVRVWGITRDLTELKLAEEQLRKSEERWRAVFENSAAGIALTDPAGTRFLSANAAFQKMLGYPEEELRALTFMDVTHEGDREANRRLLVELRGGRQSSYEMQKRYRRKDGSLIWAGIHVSMVPGTESIPRFLMAIVEDITERKRAQEELQYSFKQLRALTARLQGIREEERKSVAREIHDELGQALTAIKIDLASLMRQSPADEHQRRRAESILKLVDQTIQSVRRISTELRPGILDDLGLVAALEWAAEEFQARTGTRCRLDFPEDDIAIDQECATAMFRIFQETLTNVARHANASEMGVRLAKENGNLTLEVHDNGIGIDAEQLFGSQSLGILGMRERADLLGGELTIISAPENGTTVKVRIPVAHCALRSKAGDQGPHR